MTDTPAGRIPEAWARAARSAQALTYHVRALRRAAAAEPEEVARYHLGLADAIENALVVIRLGCPTPTGWDPMVRPDDVLRRDVRDG